MFKFYDSLVGSRGKSGFLFDLETKTGEHEPLFLRLNTQCACNLTGFRNMLT